MKTERNIFIAFILNLSFSIFEIIGGILTGSVAILSDSIHDMGDAISIGISYLFEKKSKKKQDGKYTFGYARYSVIGSLFTIFILIVGSIIVIVNAIKRFITPEEINYNGMLIFAVIGIIVNFVAAMFTHKGESLNQKAVNLHMLEDVFGWVVVLIGAIIMKFTDISLIDPIMSIGVSIFILFNALKNIKEVLNILLEKVPNSINIDEIKNHVLEIDGVIDVHHIHIWSLDENYYLAAMHIVTNKNDIKDLIKEELYEHGISHITLEIENENENCNDKVCKENNRHDHHHHHHHH